MEACGRNDRDGLGGASHEAGRVAGRGVGGRSRRGGPAPPGRRRAPGSPPARAGRGPDRGGGRGGGAAPAADSPALEIPEPFARFEHMIGSWKGTAVPAVNRLKGWPETHRWAWKFARGKPVGMSLELDGDRTLSEGQLTYR